MAMTSVRRGRGTGTRTVRTTHTALPRTWYDKVSVRYSTVPVRTVVVRNPLARKSKGVVGVDWVEYKKLSLAVNSTQLSFCNYYQVQYRYIFFCPIAPLLHDHIRAGLPINDPKVKICINAD